MESATTAPGERTVSHAQSQSRWRRVPTRTLLYHLLVGGFGLLMLYPILWLFASSFKGTAEIWANVRSLIPQDFTLANYTNGWRGFGGITFATFYTCLLYTSRCV